MFTFQLPEGDVSHYMDVRVMLSGEVCWPCGKNLPKLFFSLLALNRKSVKKVVFFSDVQCITSVMRASEGPID